MSLKVTINANRESCLKKLSRRDRKTQNSNLKFDWINNFSSNRGKNYFMKEKISI